MISPNEMLFLKERFDKVDADNAEIKRELATVHAEVDRHGLYWDITKWALGLGIPTSLASLAAWFGFTHKP